MIYNRSFFENKNKSILPSDLDFLIEQGLMKPVQEADRKIGVLSRTKIQTTKPPSRWPAWARVLWYQGSGYAARRAISDARKAGKL